MSPYCLRSAFLALAVVSTFAAAGAAQPPAATGRSDAGQEVTAESVRELGNVVAGYVRRGEAVGAELLVIQHGKVLFHESYGQADREDGRAWENDTTCNIRSMTKPITSAAAQILIDRGKLKLDAPVADYLDSFDNDKSRAITVRHVLTHRSGFPLTNLLVPYQFPSLAEQVAAAGRYGPGFEPGSKFQYSDTGTDVVGALIEKVSGEPLYEYVGREIFEPLGMADTFYGIDASDERFPTIASLYLKSGEKWSRFWKPEKKPFYPFAWGSQTVYSTTSDYAKFVRMIMNRGRAGEKQILSEAAVARMLEPVSLLRKWDADGPAATGFHGLDWHYGQMMFTYRAAGKQDGDPVILGHSGSDGTAAWAWPDRDLIILYFTQSRGGRSVRTIEDQIDRLITHHGELPDRLRPYVGTFAPTSGELKGEVLTVWVRDGKLVLDIPGKKGFELLNPDDQGRWAVARAPDRGAVTFDRNEAGEVVGLKLHKDAEVLEAPREVRD